MNQRPAAEHSHIRRLFAIKLSLQHPITAEPMLTFIYSPLFRPRGAALNYSKYSHQIKCNPVIHPGESCTAVSDDIDISRGTLLGALY